MKWFKKKAPIEYQHFTKRFHRMRIIFRDVNQRDLDLFIYDESETFPGFQDIKDWYHTTHWPTTSFHFKDRNYILNRDTIHHIVIGKGLEKWVRHPITGEEHIVFPLIYRGWD